MGGTVDDVYWRATAPASLGERLAIRARERIYADFVALCRPGPDDTILDVGVSDVVTDAANHLERVHPHPHRITAVGLGEGDGFRAAYPEVAYRRVEANRPLPFPDACFDFAVSNAVLEHVGGVERQKAFVAELARVARRVFFTVPHRFFPVEHHTAIPLLHWSDATFRLACRLTGNDRWAKPENLILMTRARLEACRPPGVAARSGTTGIGPGPFASNLWLLLGDDAEPAPRPPAP